MPKREDDTFRYARYGGHPPGCTCAKCTQLRINKTSGEPFDEEEWDWVKTSGDCPYCHHKKSQVRNEKDKKTGCLNKHCREYYKYL